jgi:hypothetical protein
MPALFQRVFFLLLKINRISKNPFHLMLYISSAALVPTFIAQQIF